MLFPLPRCGTLFLTRSAQNAFHAVVAFVAGVLEQVFTDVLVRNGQSPLFGEGAGIDDRDAVVDLSRSHTGKALDEMKILGRPAIEDLVGEVRRVYDQRRSEER